MKALWFFNNIQSTIFMSINAVVLLFPFMLSAQNYSLKGRVLDSDFKLVEGDLLLLDHKTAELIKIDAIERGHFFVTGITDKEILMKIMVPGYMDTSIVFIKTDTNVITVINDIILRRKEVQLAEIGVRAKRPLFERTRDGSMINVENTMLAASVNASEILGKTPGIAIAGNKINVFGRGEAMIVLNGKEIPYDAFKSIPPGEIKSIEVLTNPGARYDAKGKAVIVVNLKKGYNKGLSVTLTNNSTLGLIKNQPIGKHYMNSANINVNYRKDKFNLTSYYANDLGMTWNENKSTILISSPNGIYKTRSHYNEDSKSKNVHNYRVGVGYDLSEKSNLSFQYDGLYNFFNLDVQQNGDYYTPQNELTLIRMRNDATTKLVNHSCNLNYDYKLDSLGTSYLFIGAQYNRFENKLFDHIKETITPATAPTYTWYRINDGYNSIELYTAQADLTYKIKKVMAEGGVKFSYTTNAGKIKFFTKNDGTDNFQENPLFANDNLYKEIIPAAYLILKGNIKKWAYHIGARSEYSIVNGYSEKLKKNIIDSSYLNLFPSAKVNYKFNSNWESSVSYNRKINRPIYQDLDPFLWYLDSLTSIQGNSKLTPELLDQFEGNVSFKQFNFKIGYTLSQHTIWAVSKPGSTGPNSVIYTKDNIRQREIYNLGFDIPFESKYYICYNTIACNFYQFKDNRTEYKTAVTTPQLYVYSYHQFILPKLFNIDLNGEYYGASSDGFTSKQPYYYITIGASGSFMKDKLSVQVMFNDVLRSARWKGTRTIGAFTNDYNSRNNSHYIRLTIVYKLGALKNFKYNNKTINDKEFNRIKQ